MFLQIIGTGSYVYWTFPVANIATQMSRIVYRWVRTGTANGDLRVWVNGAEVAVSVAGQAGYNNTFTLNYNATEPLRLGSLDGTSQFLTGRLADVFQWDIGLPIADCLAMSNRDKSLQLVNIGDLMFGFKCDEGGGTLAVNRLGVGGATDGTITNANLALFHAVRTDGQGADWQNQVGFTPRSLSLCVAIGVGVDKFWIAVFRIIDPLASQNSTKSFTKSIVFSVTLLFGLPVSGVIVLLLTTPRSLSF